jgi:monoamine oxidase
LSKPDAAVKVLVAGAGLAGLQAAWRLTLSGHDVTVFEAKDRVGGRTWSVELGNGAVVESGGEFIHPAQHSIRGLCAELSFPLVPHGVTFERRYDSTGTRPTPDYLESVMDAFRAIVTSIPDGADDISVEEAFGSALGPGFEVDPIYLRVSTSLAASPREVSAKAFSARYGTSTYPHMEHCARVHGGNQRISLELHARLGDVVRLEHPVAGVSGSAKGVQFSFGDGALVDGDAAVIAVPLPLLRKLELDQDLPPGVTEALDALTFGTAVKLSAELNEPAPPKGVQATGERWWAWNSVDPAGEASTVSVTAFAGGPDAVESLGLDDGGKAWLGRIAALRDDLEVGDSFELTTWDDDPWTLGAYSQPIVGWRPEFFRAFDEVVGRIAFAGEHTAGELASTMNGAVSSGVRAARAIAALES